MQATADGMQFLFNLILTLWGCAFAFLFVVFGYQKACEIYDRRKNTGQS